MNRLAEAIKLVLAEEGASVGRTKLVKLLFLADLEATRQGLAPFSDGQWKYDHFGPFNWQITDTADQLAREGEICRENWEDDTGPYGGIDYAVPSATAQTVALPEAEHRIVEEVARAWRGKSLRAIKDHVYDLSVIAANERGEAFDMATAGWRDELAFYDALDEAESELGPYIADMDR